LFISQYTNNACSHSWFITYALICTGMTSLVNNSSLRIPALNALFIARRQRTSTENGVCICSTVSKAMVINVRCVSGVDVFIAVCRLCSSRLRLLTVFAFIVISIVRKSFFEWPGWDEYPAVATKKSMKVVSSEPILTCNSSAICQRGPTRSDALYPPGFPSFRCTGLCCLEFVLTYRIYVHNVYCCLQHGGPHPTGFVTQSQLSLAGHLCAHQPMASYLYLWSKPSFMETAVLQSVAL